MSETTRERLDGIGSRDHSITAEYRIFGPPGTGKTTELAFQVQRAVDRFGPDAVLVTSFSRAAAAELTGRDMPLHPSRVGTLHSHCFNALGKPRIAEVTVDDWNRRYPNLALTSASRNQRLDGEHADEELDIPSQPGDSVFQQLNRCRGLMLSREDWPVPVREFSSKWEEYKSANGSLDFCDLIEASFRDSATAPYNPAVIVADEAQDLTPQLAALVRKWGSQTSYFVFAGDDDQLVYSWVGAIPDVLLEPPIPQDQTIFLDQSYRVPRAVHELAERLIQQVSRRQHKAYAPRQADGEVRRLSQASYRSPEYLILKTAERHLRDGKSIMFIGSCSYMLRPVIAVLRKNGVPFHNPYRKSNGFWNPLRARSRHSAANRLLALLSAHPKIGVGHRDWTFGDLAMWTEWIRERGALTSGAREAISKYSPHKKVSIDLLKASFEGDVFAKLQAALGNSPCALLNWWRENLAPDFRKRIQFPSDVVALRGPHALRQEPRVIVGTIHSVKGGQADVVYLFPDLSNAGETQYRQRGLSRDSVIRTFYVGATRARETLYICSASGAMAVSL
jgi:DNA helicase-2/ATP-dependent DNA helicase PcrA